MHGLIFASLRDYTIHRLGEERTGEIWGDRLFETTEAYADEWFLAQLERLAAAAGETVAETERGFGLFAAEKTFAGLFPGYYAESGDTCTFLLGVEEKIHELVRATIPGATPPKLHVQPLGDLGVLVSYTSERRLCRLLEGLVHGTAAHYGEQDRARGAPVHAPRRRRLRLLGHARGGVRARRGAFCLPLETGGADPDTEAVLKGYLIGLLSATLAILLVAVIWFGRQPPQEEGLLWGGKVYTSRQEFNGYLKSKGLSYETFVARNPGASPWEPDEFTIGPVTVRASIKTREDWVVWLPLAAIGLMLAIGCALLLWLWLRPRLRTVTRTVTPGLARRSAAFFSEVSTVLLVAVIFGLLYAAIGLILATDYALLLLQRVRTVLAGFARRSLAFVGQRRRRIGPSPASRRLASSGSPSVSAL